MRRQTEVYFSRKFLVVQKNVKIVCHEVSLHRPFSGERVYRRGPKRSRCQFLARGPATRCPGIPHLGCGIPRNRIEKIDHLEVAQSRENGPRMVLWDSVTKWDPEKWYPGTWSLESVTNIRDRSKSTCFWFRPFWDPPYPPSCLFASAPSTLPHKRFPFVSISFSCLFVLLGPDLRTSVFLKVFENFADCENLKKKIAKRRFFGNFPVCEK